MRKKLRLTIVLVTALCVTILLTPFQLIGLAGVPWLSRHVPVLYHKIIAWLFGVRITLDGALYPNRPLMIVANHVSWLDIVILSSIAPLSFVAKAEMATWPLFGQLAWMQRTIFVKRQERRRSAEQANQIAERLGERDTMVLFPEGTTSDGHAMLPFKTTLFEAARLALADAHEEHAVIQPVAIDYTRLHGLPLARQFRQHVAWPGDVGLGEHFLPLVATGALDVIVHLGEPIAFTAQSNRKVVAAQCQDAIRRMLNGAALDSAQADR